MLPQRSKLGLTESTNDKNTRGFTMNFTKSSWS